MTPSTPIAIITAIPQEFALLAEWMGEEAGGGQPVVGQLDGLAIAMSTCGIGKVNAASTATQLIERFSPDILVFSGVAGGIDPALGIGDVVIGTTAIQHDAGVLGPDGLEPYQAGHIPFFNPTDRFGFQPSPALLERCRRRLEGFSLDPFADGRTTRIVFGTILTGDQYLASDADRERLRSRFGGQAVDMESAAVAQVADQCGLDHLVIRSLSDLAGAESDLDFTRFLSHVAANSAATLRHLLPILLASG